MRSPMFVAVPAALLAMQSALLAQTSPAGGAAPALPPAMAAAGPDFRQVVQSAKERVFPALVYIRVIREANEMGKKESQALSGSGVLVSATGDVLTNWHVVDKAESVRCLLTDGRHFEAKVLGSDKDTDLAVIRLQGVTGSLPFASLGDSRGLREGDFVMAMGAPWGLNRSVSIGIISCTHRYLETASEYSDWLQTDAAINPGNSGGPLVNTQGQVIGINARGSAGFAEGLGFAIPAETVALLMPSLRDRGHMDWSWTGLQLQPLRDFNKDTYFEATEGVIVGETDPDSPARRAGLQPRDRIIKVNGATLTALTQEDIPAVRRVLGLLPKGQEATIDFLRGDEAQQVKLTPREKGKVEGEELALKRFDFSVKTINQFDNPTLYFHRKEGVFIYGVKYPGNAGNAGLYNQDIVLKIDNKEVKTLDDIRRVHEELVAGVEKNHRVVVVVLRKGLQRQVVLDFRRDYEKE